MQSISLSLLYAWSLQSRVDKGGEYSEGEAGDWTVICLREQQWCGLRGHGVEWLRTRVPEAVSPGLRSFLFYFLDSCLCASSFLIYEVRIIMVLGTWCCVGH